MLPGNTLINYPPLHDKMYNFEALANISWILCAIHLHKLSRDNRFFNAKIKNQHLELFHNSAPG